MKSDGKIQDRQHHTQPLEDGAERQRSGAEPASIVVVAAIVVVDDRVLLTKRPANVHLPNLWEFPGGKVEPRESLIAALQRELLEELGVEVDVLDEYFSTTHRYPEKSVELHFFNCRIRSGEPRALEVAEFQWVRIGELRSWKLPDADRELIERICRTSFGPLRIS